MTSGSNVISYHFQDQKLVFGSTQFQLTLARQFQLSNKTLKL